MTLHPDILNDLLLLYRAGEASGPTRSLLEQLAASDADLARRMAPGADAPPVKIDVPTPDAQRRALSAIAYWNRMYSLFTGLAAALALIPFTVVFRHGKVTFFLFRDAPGLAIASLSIAIASAIAAWRFHKLRRLDFTD
jgi:hypothetical protein